MPWCVHWIWTCVWCKTYKNCTNLLWNLKIQGENCQILFPSNLHGRIEGIHTKFDSENFWEFFEDFPWWSFTFCTSRSFERSWDKWYCSKEKVVTKLCQLLAQKNNERNLFSILWNMAGTVRMLASWVLETIEKWRWRAQMRTLAATLHEWSFERKGSKCYA